MFTPKQIQTATEDVNLRCWVQTKHVVYELAAAYERVEALAARWSRVWVASKEARVKELREALEGPGKP
jgi:hypothetical protein